MSDKLPNNKAETILQRSIDDLVDRNFKITDSKGFFESPSGYATQTLLIATEIFEALKELNIRVDRELRPIMVEFFTSMQALEIIRKENARLEDDNSDIKEGRKENLLEELADIVIRVFSLAGYLQDAEPVSKTFSDILLEKMEVNLNREYKHGKQF